MDEIGLLDGGASWNDFRAARGRFFEGLSRRKGEVRGNAAPMTLRRFVEAWGARDADAVAAQFSVDGVRHQFASPEARLRGRTEIALGVAAIIRAVPDCRLDVRARVEGGGGVVALEWTFTGTYERDLPGFTGGTGIVLPGISVVTVGSDGLIVLENVYWDRATLMAALGTFD